MNSNSTYVASSVISEEPLSYGVYAIPEAAGIGLRARHYQEIARSKPAICWLEVHPENFFAEGGIAPYMLERIRADYPLSVHGVGLSLGRIDKLDMGHLQSLKRVIDRFEPALVSEHVSWSAVNGIFLNDLLPLPYTREAADVMVRNIEQVQEYLGRQILIENPSTYLEFTVSEMSEYEFIAQIVKRSGCGVLLDVNNMYVVHKNHGIDMDAYIAAIPSAAVKEIHLAGFYRKKLKEGQEMLIDTHGARVYDEVWQLYRKVIATYGTKPTLIEWDTDVPELSILQEEANRAQALLDEVKGEKHGRT